MKKGTHTCSKAFMSPPGPQTNLVNSSTGISEIPLPPPPPPPAGDLEFWSTAGPVAPFGDGNCSLGVGLVAVRE